MIVRGVVGTCLVAGAAGALAAWASSGQGGGARTVDRVGGASFLNAAGAEPGEVPQDLQAGPKGSPGTAVNTRQKAQGDAGPLDAADSGAPGRGAVIPPTKSSPVKAPAPGVASATAGTAAFDARAAAFGGYGWVTRPNRDAVMAFTFPVEVAQVAVVQGQAVKEGDLLVRARDGEAAASLEVQRVRAENSATVANARAGLELAAIRLAAARRAQAESAMTAQEFEERRLGHVAAEAGLANALSTQNEEQKRLVQMQEQVQRYRLLARFDGIVDMISAEPGQGVDINQPVVRIVNVDPLWVDVPTPVDETLRLDLKVGAPAWVLLDVPAERAGSGTVRGRVLSVASTTDAAGTRRVRVELPNPELLPAGLRAQVRFTADAAKQ